jgi:hypothetical protein
MRLFPPARIAVPPTNLPDQPPVDPANHPAYRMGQYLANWFGRGLHGIADWLNAGQHRLGFRLRNVLLALTGLAFLLYFLSLLR